MGESYKFICRDCSYSACVCGGKAIGMATVVVTVVCRDCKALYDAVADQEPWDVFKDGQIRGKLTGLECPEDPTHDAIQWRHPWSCPKCGTRMEKGGTVLNWD